MPITFVVFLLLFTAAVCIVSVLLGAYLMHCKQRAINPLQHIKYPQMDPKKEKEPDVKGFFD